MKRLRQRFKAWALRRLCAKRRQPFDTSGIQRIVVMRHDRIGDMVVSTPLLRKLRQGFPGAHIAVLASPANAAIVELNPHVDEVVVLHKDLRHSLPALLGLRRRRFDLGIELFHDVRWPAIAVWRAIRPRWLLSTHKDGRYGVAGHELHLYDRMGPPLLDQTLSETYLDLAGALDLPRTPGDSRFEVFLSPAQHAAAAALVAGRSQPLIGINLFGSRPSMRLPFSDGVATARYILERYPTSTLLLFCAPACASETRRLAEAIGTPSRVVAVSPTASIADTAALVAELDLLVTPDTALVHLASAFDIPVVAIYANAPALFVHWRPAALAGKFRAVFAQESKGLGGFSQAELFAAIDAIENDCGGLGRA